MTNLHSRFHQEYKFCPKCKTNLDREENLVKCTNQSCGFFEYSNPAPCICAAIIRDGEILLAIRGIEPEKGKWDVPGGFVEAGESLEECAKREVKEETNLDTTKIINLGSIQDIYAGRPTIASIYLMEVKLGEPIPLDDVAELRWFNFNDLPVAKEMAFANTTETIKRAKKYLKNN